MVQISSPPEGTTCLVDGQKDSPSTGQNLPPNYTNIKNTKNRKAKRENSAPLGSYQNVFLSADELQSLRKEFPSQADVYIDKLSVYMRQKGKRYDDHAATIRKWISEDHEDSPVYNYDYTYEEGECL